MLRGKATESAVAVAACVDAATTAVGSIDGIEVETTTEGAL